jgi:hypothetical protein
MIVFAASVAAVTGLTLGLVAAAGPSTHSPVAGRPVATSGAGDLLAAYRTTVAASSARASLSLSSTGGTTATVDAIVDLSTDVADVTANLPAPLGSVEAISTGTSVYLKLPPFAQTLTGGKPWAKLDRTTVENLFGSQVGAPQLGSTLDVTGVIGWLKGVTGNITYAGTDTIHGTPTTHYRATLDLTRVAAGASPSTRSDIRRLATALGQNIPIDAWTDSQGRLRQLQASIDTTKLQAPVPTHLKGIVTVTADLWDFGTPVGVTTPPADQVTNIDSLGSLLGP